MHSDAKRHYAILELAPGASDEDVRTAFRRRAKELHPDSESGSAGAFIRLKRAYDVLSDPAARADYDRACLAMRRAARRRARAAAPRTVRRRGGGFLRYVLATLFMGALSLGAIELMIIFTEPPPTTRSVMPSLVPSAPRAEVGVGAGAPRARVAPEPVIGTPIR